MSKIRRVGEEQVPLRVETPAVVLKSADQQQLAPKKGQLTEARVLRQARASSRTCTASFLPHSQLLHTCQPCATDLCSTWASSSSESEPQPPNELLELLRE